MSDAASPSPELNPGLDFDLRLVRYFVVVAEHLNFVRAAQALHVAQPSLSRQVRRLEDALGVRLLERTTQGSSLTAAGAAFLPQAQALLHSAHQAVSTASAAASPRAITIGYVEDLVITPAVRALRRRHPDAHVATRHLNWNESSALADQRVDVLVTRTPLPVPSDELHLTALYDEPRVLLVAAAHRLAGKESIDPADLAEDPLVPCSGMPAMWNEFWRLEPRPDGNPAPLGPMVVDTFEDKLELIASGQAIAVAPINDRRHTLRDDIAAIPIDAVEPSQVVVATRADDDTPLVARFRESAQQLLIRQA